MIEVAFYRRVPFERPEDHFMISQWHEISFRSCAPSAGDRANPEDGVVRDNRYEPQTP
jgi:hypothetical protein